MAGPYTVSAQKEGTEKPRKVADAPHGEASGGTVSRALRPGSPRRRRRNKPSAATTTQKTQKGQRLARSSYTGDAERLVHPLSFSARQPQNTRARIGLRPKRGALAHPSPGKERFYNLFVS